MDGKNQQQNETQSDSLLALGQITQLLQTMENMGRNSDSLAKLREAHSHERLMRILQIYETTIQTVKSPDVINHAAFAAFILNATMQSGGQVNEQLLKVLASKIPDAEPRNWEELVKKCLEMESPNIAEDTRNINRHSCPCKCNSPIQYQPVVSQSSSLPNSPTQKSGSSGL